MKKTTLLCLLLCFVFLLAACDDTSPATTPDQSPGSSTEQPPPPPPPPPVAPNLIYAVDFSGGETGYIMLNTGAIGTDPDSIMEIVPLDGANALKLTAPNGENLRVGFNVDGLLGDRATDVKTVVFEVFAEYPDGSFSAVQGRTFAYRGTMDSPLHNNWTIYLASRNPNQATISFGANDGFVAGGPNVVELACLVNGPADRGETPAVIYIKSINFYDASNEGLAVDMKAGWRAPDGYGEAPKVLEHELPWPAPYGNPGGWQSWFSYETDDEEDPYLLWETLYNSIGFVFETEEPESFEIYYMGGFNGWSWQQHRVPEYWEDGKITVMWDDVGFDPKAHISADSTSFKFGLGNWNQIKVTAAYLLVVEG